MIEQTSDFLARKLRQNWLTRHTDKLTSNSPEQDDSLTNLNWLQNINLTKFASPNIQISPPPTPVLQNNGAVGAASKSLCNSGPNGFGTPRFMGSSTSMPTQQAPWLNLPNMTDVNQTRKQYINLFSTGHTHSRPSMLLSSARHQTSASRSTSGSRASMTMGSRYCDMHISSNPRSQSDCASSISSDPTTPCIHGDSAHFGLSNSSGSGNLLTGDSTLDVSSSDSGNHYRSSAFNTSPDFNGTNTEVRVEMNKSGSIGDDCIPRCSTALHMSYNHTDPRSQRSTSTSLARGMHPQENGGRTPLQTIPLTPVSPSIGLNSLGPLRTGHSTYPSLLQRHEPRRPVSLAADMVDISSSGLFHSLDAMDAPTRSRYRTDPTTRPPFTYHCLIYMTMQCLKRQKVTLSDVCTWIRENFAFFRNATNSWQNELRQNLTSSRCFQRVPRRKEEPGGRGDLWRLSPELQTQLAKHQISMKFLHFWHHDVRTKQFDDVLHGGRIFDGLGDNDCDKNTSDCNNAMTTKFDNDGCCYSKSLVSSGMENQWGASVKRRRVNWSQAYPPYAEPHTSQHMIIQDAASCSTSSSSPPLSDICTPPLQPAPNLIYASTSNSPTSFDQPGIFDTVTDCDVKHIQTPSDFCLSDCTLSSQTIIKKEEPMDSPGYPSPTTNHTSNGDSLTFNDKSSEFLHRGPELDGCDELSKACGLHDIPPLDLNPITNALDLTVRGIGLKSTSSDWWTHGLAESMTSFLSATLGTGDDALTSVVDSSLGDGAIDTNSHDLTTPEAELRIASLLPTNSITMDGSDFTANLAGGTFFSNQLSSNLLGVHNQFAVESALSFAEDQRWIDEQLNLEELDSILGLT